MLRAFLVALAAAVGVTGEPSPAPRDLAPTPLAADVVAVFFHHTGPGSELARVDPLTLKPTRRVLTLAGGSAWVTAYSPDGKKLAVSGGLGAASVELVDLRRMRSLGVVDLEMDGDVRFLSWDDGYLFAVVDDYARRAVVSIDPRGSGVQTRHLVDGTILQVERGINQQVVLLLGPTRGIGPLRLAVVGGKDMVETAVRKLTGGTSVQREGEDIRAREVIPALVVDREGRRAFVYSPGAVVEISLNNLRATTHGLSEPVSVWRRFRNWFEPAAQAKIVEGSYRSGEWIGDGRFAVSGMDFAEEESAAAGLTIVDTESWTQRKIADGGTELAVSGDTLLTFGYHANEGIRGYDLMGRERFHLLRGRGAWVQLVGGLAYAQIGDGTRIAVIDPAVGRKIGEAEVGRPVMLVDDPPTSHE
jgi:hypothetical protein